MTSKRAKKQRVQPPTTKVTAPLRQSPGPDLLAILRALHRTGAPASKSDRLTATNADDPRWFRGIHQLLDAGLVDKEGERRWTRYRLARQAGNFPHDGV